MLKAAIYDMDDLMVNSDPMHALAWEKSLEVFGKSFADLPEELRSKFIGMRVIDICEEIIDVLKLDTDLETFYKGRIDSFLVMVEENLEMMPGLTYSLDLLKENDFQIALASSGAKKYINLVLDKFEIREYFDVIVSGDCVSVGKPDPETYLVAAEKLGLESKECVVFEDATNGIKSAVDAGCKCVAVINPNTPPQDHSEADLVLNSLQEVSIEKLKGL